MILKSTLDLPSVLYKAKSYGYLSAPEDIPKNSCTMKLIVLFFLVGCASAFVNDALDSHAELIHEELMDDLEESAMFYAEEDVKTDLEEKLREALKKVIEKIKDAIEKGKTVRENLLNKLKEIRENMKERGMNIGNKAKKALEKVRERIRNLLNDLLDNFKTKTRRSVDDVEVIEALSDSFLKDLFRRLKKEITDRIDKDRLKAKIEEIFGKGNELADSILDIINVKGEKYKDKLHELIDRYLKPREKKSLREMWEKVKDYFKDLHIDLKEKYMKFGEWFKEVIGTGLQKGKDRITNIRNIAKEFIDHTKGVSKDVAVEALEFLRPYKDDLGSLWEQVKETVKDIINKKE